MIYPEYCSIVYIYIDIIIYQSQKWLMTWLFATYLWDEPPSWSGGIMNHMMTAS